MNGPAEGNKESTNMAMMKVVTIPAPGGPEILRITNRPKPTPGPHEVLIEVYYSGINRPDVFQRKGHYPAPAGVVADVPGLEVSGRIVACGALVTRWKSGDAVCALLPGGGYAAFALAHEGHCLPLAFSASERADAGDLFSNAPSSNGPRQPQIDFSTGAALPETVFTVWHNVFQLGRLSTGERMLVHGGSGGIGTTAIQLGRLFGAEVYTTAGTDERAARCVSLGAVESLNYRKTDFATYWGQTDLKMNVILDSVGGAYFDKNISLLAPEGRLVQINCTAGRRVELDLLALMRGRYQLTGSTLRARDDGFKRNLRDTVEANVWPLVRTGAFSPVIDRIFPFEDVADAHRYLESGSAFGKILLSWHPQS